MAREEQAKSSEAPRKVTAQDEREIVRRAQAGDLAAYEQLVKSHQRRVLAIVNGVLRRSEDVEDVAQQVFIKVYVSIRRFDHRSAFGTWLYKIAVNECRDYLRKKRARRLVYEADMTEQQVWQLGAIEQTDGLHVDAEKRAELRQFLDRLLEELTDEERTLLLLKEVEGYSVEEIGDILEMNVNTVKVKLFRARGRMTEHYRRRLRAQQSAAGKPRTQPRTGG